MSEHRAAPQKEATPSGYCRDCEQLCYLVAGTLCDMCRGVNVRKLSEAERERLAAPQEGETPGVCSICHGKGLSPEGLSCWLCVGAKKPPADSGARPEEEAARAEAIWTRYAESSVHTGESIVPIFDHMGRRDKKTAEELRQAHNRVVETLLDQVKTLREENKKQREYMQGYREGAIESFEAANRERIKAIQRAESAEQQATALRERERTLREALEVALPCVLDHESDANIRRVQSALSAPEDQR